MGGGQLIYSETFFKLNAILDKKATNSNKT